MHQRKVQLIAGTTYTVSLPKSWVRQHNVSHKSRVSIEEKEDGTLLLSPGSGSQSTDKESISINIDDQEQNISHIIFAAYYMGYENIRLFSRKEMRPATRNKIKSTIYNLSGVEIVFEDLSKIDVKVLLDISKTDLKQLLFRTNLLINAGIDIILERNGLDDLERNEDEVDRMHHLITKMIYLASTNTAVLHSSGIKNISHILSYSALNKKMENIADSLTDLGRYVLEQQKSDKVMVSLLDFFKKRLSRDIGLLMKDNLPEAHAKDMTEMGKVYDELASIGDAQIRIPLSNLADLIVDIEEELMNLMYYRKLME
ncbi:phosphate uptake regulator PhoU [Candidatus Woesearchaeota archaeon]|nr:phosphate uptake regulator PhoU [Candidatus Woesearchaeota archaeon]